MPAITKPRLCTKSGPCGQYIEQRSSHSHNFWWLISLLVRSYETNGRSPSIGTWPNGAYMNLWDYLPTSLAPFWVASTLPW